MNIPIQLVVVFISAILALQGWTLVELIALKIEIAKLKTRLEDYEIPV